MKRTEKLKKLVSSQSFILVIMTYAIVLVCTFISLCTTKEWKNDVLLPKLIDAIFPTTITLVLSILCEIQTENQKDERIAIASVSFLLLYTLITVLFAIRALTWRDELVGNFIAIVFLSIACITSELYFLHDLRDKKTPSAE